MLHNSEQLHRYWRDTREFFFCLLGRFPTHLHFVEDSKRTRIHFEGFCPKKNLVRPLRSTELDGRLAKSLFVIPDIGCDDERLLRIRALRMR